MLSELEEGGGGGVESLDGGRRRRLRGREREKRKDCVAWSACSPTIVRKPSGLLL